MAHKHRITHSPDWLRAKGMTVLNQANARQNEDDFDALISAAALARIFLGSLPLENADTVDELSEGGILGEACLCSDTSQRNAPKPVSKLQRGGPVERIKRYYPCPIPGCPHVFKNSRGGWDAHVASHKRHPSWHPETRDPAERKAIFKKEFSGWF